MKEQIVTFKTAMQLTKLINLESDYGYDSNGNRGTFSYAHTLHGCFFYHDVNKCPFYPQSSFISLKPSEARHFKDGVEFELPTFIPAPTQTSVQKYLRETHNLQVYAFSSTINKKGEFRDYVVYINNKALNDARDEEYQTYEEAIEFGLQQALIQLYHERNQERTSSVSS